MVNYTTIQGFVDDTTNTYVASYAFNQVIDVNEIESVLFTKDTINVGEIPTEDNQSNFGSGFGYQYGADDTIEIYMNEKWFVFEYREESE